MTSHPAQDTDYTSSLHPSRHGHASRPSLDTNASGLAESAISFSAFPPPPSSIPSPILSISPSQSSAARGHPGPLVRPLLLRRGHNLPATSSGPSLATSNPGNPHPREATSRSQATEQPASASRELPRPIAPSAWNDAASGISGISGISGLTLDPTEDRLLSTSFITSLLQENHDLRRAQRASTASDALSGISEMTYPPPSSLDDPSRYQRHGAGSHRPQPSRLGAPPTSFAAIPENAQRMSSDSETLHSVQGHSGSKQGSSSHRNHSSQSPSGQTFPVSVSGHDKDSDSIMQYKAMFQPPPYSGTEEPPPQRRIPRNVQPSHEARGSVHSFKSLAPSFISRISVPRSLRRAFTRNRTAKPLPPVPLIPDISLAAEAQYRRADEAAPLPVLVNRAGQLHGILEKEYNYRSEGLGISDYDASKSDASSYQTSSQSRTMHSWQPLRRRDVTEFGAPTHIHTAYGSFPASNDKRNGWRTCLPKSCLPRLTRRVWIIFAGVATLLVGVIIAVVVVVSKKNRPASLQCDLALVGSLCRLNATCVCTSSTQCNGLAQNIVDLIPVVNQEFSGNLTTTDVYTSLWLAQGTTKDCSAQSLLVDTGKSLDPSIHPNRTRWAQAALLWNVVRSQDLESATSMQLFAETAPWNDLGDSDGPTDSDGSPFTSTFSGYAYNFAAQTVSQPSTTFASQGQPSSDQAARVGTKAQAALDRMYSYALASSTQREVALQNYWTTTLSQRIEDLATFKAILGRSPVLLPFNGSSSTIRSLYTSSSLLFPPPLACYPGFSPQLLDQVQTFETAIFNLDRPTAASSFDAACFPDRPIYGILDLLRLRLPYLDSRPSLPRQAAVLKTEALSRVVVYVNEVLSATFPGSKPRGANFTRSDLDPRSFGTLNLPNHVILQYLSSMPVNVAIAVVNFVLEAATMPVTPPDPSSSLFNILSSIPVLEVAIFGNIGPSDVSGTVSSFMTSTGTFFFGSDAGSALRNWTIPTAGGTVVWAENSTAPRIVRDNLLTDATVDQAWRAVASNRNVVLGNLTTAFEATQKFTAT